MADVKSNPIGSASLAVPDGVVLMPVHDCDGLYDAGSDGHIYCYSRARNNAKKPTPFRLSEHFGSEGYPFVSVVLDGKRRSKSVHILVCAAFHGLQDGKIVRHLDGDRTNNVPSNLQCGSYAENEADKKRHGTAAEGSRHGIAKLNEEAVRILRIAIPQGLWNPVDAAKAFGVQPCVIRAAVRNKSWKHVSMETDDV